MENGNFFQDHPDLNQIEQRIDEGWRLTQEALSKATARICKETIEPGPNFWSDHSVFFADLEPEIAAVIMGEAENIHSKLIKRARRKELLRGLGRAMLDGLNNPFGLHDDKHN